MTDGVGRRLKEARKAAGYKTAKEFAERNGIPQPTYAMHELGTRGLKQNRAIEYARLLNVTLEWLLTGNGIGPNSAERSAATAGSNVSPGPETIHYLPLISWVQAGAWAEVADPYQPGDYERLVPVTRRYSNHAYALKIKGDSMQAAEGVSFPDGSIICVEPNQDARHGSYVVMKLEESQEATFKQLVIDGDRRYLKPLNQRYPIIEITREAVVCGVVRQLVMDFGD